LSAEVWWLGLLKVSTCPKRTFCPILSRNEDIVKKCYFNTLTSRLIQAVRKKTAGSLMALRGNISAPVQVTDLVEVSKDTASLVVCT